jgi:hypothetical protein
VERLLVLCRFILQLLYLDQRLLDLLVKLFESLSLRGLGSAEGFDGLSVVRIRSLKLRNLGILFLSKLRIVILAGVQFAFVVIDVLFECIDLPLEILLAVFGGRRGILQ